MRTLKIQNLIIVLMLLITASCKKAAVNQDNDRDSLQKQQAVTELNTKYYVSAAGNDANNGTSTSTPWKTLNKVSTSTFGAGDQILFRSGDTFVGQLQVSSSGSSGSPIIFDKYGTGAKPIIDGANAAGGAYGAAVIATNKQYIEFRNLEITNNRTVNRSGVDKATAYGILISNTSATAKQYFRFTGLTIRNIYAVSIAGVAFNAISSSGIRIDGPGLTQDIRVDNCLITRTTRFGVSSSNTMDLVISNNQMTETGGSGIQPKQAENILMENNTFDYPGSNIDPRMTARGSAVWIADCKDVVLQKNISRHVRGPQDSYGYHIDHDNTNILYQYNISQDAEGGFVEILGLNKNVTYRFNISINDGNRADAKTLWLSTYGGSDNPGGGPSDRVYIYNNTVYVNGKTPNIDLSTGTNVHVFNNIFHVASGSIGQTTNIKPGTDISNNLFFGDVNTTFVSSSTSSYTGDAKFTSPTAADAPLGFRLLAGSPALNRGKGFSVPTFPKAGTGIFSGIPTNAPSLNVDYFGNAVNISGPVNIGAYNGAGL